MPNTLNRFKNGSLILATACVFLLILRSYTGKEYEDQGHGHHHHHHHDHDGHDHHDHEGHKNLFTGGLKSKNQHDEKEKLLVIANTIDADNNRQISREEIRTYIEQHINSAFPDTMNNTNTRTPLHRHKIDTEGIYLPFPGYTIVSHIMHPPPKPLTALVNYLSSSELQKYYSFLPIASYHVTINPLENVHDEHKSLLHDEQRKLIQQNSSTICTAEKLISSRGLRIDVQFKNDDNNENFENIIQNVRSIELQQANILTKYTMPWHLTLAYQYKNIEDDETKTRLDQIIENIPQSSSFPFDIPLDHIRICHFEDMTQFTPIQ